MTVSEKPWLSRESARPTLVVEFYDAVGELIFTEGVMLPMKLGERHSVLRASSYRIVEERRAPS
jgi:hypothetical protein